MKKIRPAFLSVVSNARLISKSQPTKYRVKKQMADVVRNSLKLFGWKEEGRIIYSNGRECFGMTNGEEHITVTDVGVGFNDFGGTEIDVVVVPMTIVRNHQVYLS